MQEIKVETVEKTLNLTQELQSQNQTPQLTENVKDQRRIICPKCRGNCKLITWTKIDSEEVGEWSICSLCTGIGSIVIYSQEDSSRDQSMSSSTPTGKEYAKYRSKQQFTSMSIREHMSCHIMANIICSNRTYDISEPIHIELIAEFAVKAADQLLITLQKEPFNA